MTDTLPAPTNRYQEKFGSPSGRAATKVVDHLDDYVQSFIRNAPFAVMATADGDGRCDASPKGGFPVLSKFSMIGTCCCPTCAATGCSRVTRTSTPVPRWVSSSSSPASSTRYG